MTRKTSSLEATGYFPDPEPVPTAEVAPLGFDEVRSSWTGVGLALYALDPGGSVTLEIHSEGEVYSFTAATAAEAFLLAFPPLADVFG